MCFFCEMADNPPMEAMELELAEMKRTVMLKDEEILLQHQRIQELQTVIQSWRKGKLILDLTEQVNVMREKIQQVDLLQQNVSELQLENVALKSKVAVEKEWSDRDTLVASLQDEVASQKQLVQQEIHARELTQKELERVTQKLVDKSSQDLSEINQLNDQVEQLRVMTAQCARLKGEARQAEAEVQRLRLELQLATRLKDKDGGPDGADGTTHHIDLPHGPPGSGFIHAQLRNKDEELCKLRQYIKQDEEDWIHTTIVEGLIVQGWERDLEECALAEYMETELQQSRMQVESLQKAMVDLAAQQLIKAKEHATLLKKLQHLEETTGVAAEGTPRSVRSPGSTPTSTPNKSFSLALDMNMLSPRAAEIAEKLTARNRNFPVHTVSPRSRSGES